MGIYKKVRKGYKKNWKTFGSVYKPLSKSTYNVIKDVAKNVSLKYSNAEHKWNDETYDSTLQVQSAGTFSQGTAGFIPQGDGVSERVGRSIKATQYSMNVLLRSNQNLSEPCLVRMMLVWTKQETFTPSDILENYSGNSVSDPLCYYRKEAPNVNVLMDKTFLMGVYGDPSIPYVKNIRKTFNLGHHIKYANDSTTPQYGDIYLVTMVDSGSTGTDDNVLITGRIRLSFLDD